MEMLSFAEYQRTASNLGFCTKALINGALVDAK